jgi:hypothetical protein
MFLRYVESDLPDYTVSQLRILQCEAKNLLTLWRFLWDPVRNQERCVAWSGVVLLQRSIR